MRLLLSALLAFAPAAPVAAQVRGVLPGSFSGSAPTIVPSLGASLAPGLLALPLAGQAGLPVLSLAPAFSPALSAPIPALAASVIPTAAAAFMPAAFMPAALVPGAAAARSDRPSRRTPRAARSLKDIGDFFDENPVVGASGAKLFDGAADAEPLADSLTSPAKTPFPVGAGGVTIVRVRSAAEARDYIPDGPNNKSFLQDLPARWSAIGWLDLRLYQDQSGGYFRAIDLTGRPGLIDRLPEVEPHEAELVKKIQLHTSDLQIMLREEGKTPDLVVEGVVTEMKSLFPGGDFALQLASANEQVLAHARRHGLAPGAAAIDLRTRKSIPVGRIRKIINDYVLSGADIGLASVSVFAGAERRVFVRGADGLFDVPGARRRPKAAAPVKPLARFLVPDALGRAAVPDFELIVREVTEPVKRLRAAGVKATVTVYGSARILPPAAARAALAALIEQYGAKPKRPEERKLVYAARQAVEVSKYYEIARGFGRIVAENGGGEVAVVTGGGPGIMEAANRGAFEAGGPSVGYNILLDKEQGLNKYATPGLDFAFEHFATRKMALRHGAMGLVYFPGGFGTMDELFEVLTLMQTRKMPRVPIVLIGEKAYWDKILDFDEFSRLGLISHGDLSLFRFADTAEEAWRAVVGVPALR